MDIQRNVPSVRLDTPEDLIGLFGILSSSNGYGHELSQKLKRALVEHSIKGYLTEAVTTITGDSAMLAISALDQYHAK